MVLGITECLLQYLILPIDRNSFFDMDIYVYIIGLVFCVGLGSSKYGGYRICG